MNLTYETVNLLMLLIPGLISSIIFNLIRKKVKASSFDTIIESSIFTFLIYVLLNWSYGWEPLAQIHTVGNTSSYTFSADSCLIFLTLAYSIILPMIFGTIVHYDIHMLVFRKMKLTDKTSRDTAWDDVFTDETRFLTIHLKDERRISGWPLYYSNNKEEGFIYLSNPSWIDNNNEYLSAESHGILVNRESIDLIEFMNTTEERPSNEQK